MSMRLALLAALLFAATLPCRAETGDPAVAAFDGRWSVDLVCPDTRDRNGLVRGYVFSFEVTVADGRMAGQRGVAGSPSSVAFTGLVARDGTLEIKAVGMTGNPEYTVGDVTRGTPYAYTMSGRLDGSQGQAIRRELRPCTASFGRL